MWVIALSLDGWWVDHAHGPALAILSLLCWHRPKLQGLSASLKHVTALTSDFLALSCFLQWKSVFMQRKHWFINSNLSAPWSNSLSPRDLGLSPIFSKLVPLIFPMGGSPLHISLDQFMCKQSTGKQKEQSVKCNASHQPWVLTIYETLH